MRPEHRKSTRRFVRHGARIVGADGTALGPCVMIDISGTGARLKTDSSQKLPDEFILLLSHDGRLHRRFAVPASAPPRTVALGNMKQLSGRILTEDNHLIWRRAPPIRQENDDREHLDPRRE